MGVEENVPCHRCRRFDIVRAERKVSFQNDSAYRCIKHEVVMRNTEEISWQLGLLAFLDQRRTFNQSWRARRLHRHMCDTCESAQWVIAACSLFTRVLICCFKARYLKWSKYHT